MKFRLTKCCYGVSLRFGCILAALSDMCMDLAKLEFDNLPKVSYVILKTVFHFIEIMHVLGCIMLFLGCIVKSSPLVVLYLVAGSIKIIFIIVTAYAWLFCSCNSILTICVFSVQALLGIYFWLAAYSFFRQCRDPVLPPNRKVLPVGS